MDLTLDRLFYLKAAVSRVASKAVELIPMRDRFLRDILANFQDVKPATAPLRDGLLDKFGFWPDPFVIVII
jgi:hypothetical protein